MSTIELSYERNRQIEREALKKVFNEFNEKSIELGFSNLQNVHTPYFLCDEIIKKLDEYCGNLKNKTFGVFNFEFIDVLVNVYGVPKENITFFTDNDLKCILMFHKYNGVNVMKKNFDKESLMEKNPWGGKTFDCVILNPPYQAPKEMEHKGRGKCGTSIWDKFIEKALQILKKDGYLVAIHPSGWRDVKGNFENVKQLLQSLKMCYLEMHHRDDGLKTFNAYTSYDWYVLQNRDSSINHISEIKMQSGQTEKLNLSSVDFIPNDCVKEINHLIAKEGEEKVTLLWDCKYHTQAREKDGTMQKQQTDKHKYPCVYTVGKQNNVNKWWSSKREQFFDIPKVIFSNGTSGLIFDKNGDYGLTQFAYGITTDIYNLELIYKAMATHRFIELIGHCQLMGKHRYQHKVISLFRKDFWKEFVNEDGTEKE